jgi:hypothetical protein
MPEFEQLKKPQRVHVALVTPVLPKGPPTPVATTTAAGLPPPPAPPPQPDEKAALKFLALPLESMKMPASPDRIHE